MKFKITMIIGIVVGFVGCTPLIRELKKPPYPCVLSQSARVVGIKLSYQGYGLQLGFCSETLTLIPCSTNQIYAPPFADRFKLGQNGFDTSITQQIDSGFKGDPPPLMNRLFSPKSKDELPPKPKLQSLTPHPMSVTVGALDSFAPVFALQFNETDRKPIAVLELNADDALNTYSVVGSITYTNLPPTPPK